MCEWTCIKNHIYLEYASQEQSICWQIHIKCVYRLKFPEFSIILYVYNFIGWTWYSRRLCRHILVVHLGCCQWSIHKFAWISPKIPSRVHIFESAYEMNVCATLISSTYIMASFHFNCGYFCRCKFYVHVIKGSFLALFQKECCAMWRIKFSFSHAIFTVWFLNIWNMPIFVSNHFKWQCICYYDRIRNVTNHFQWCI